ncbi:ATP-binding protein [Streptosporangiaceae bacterium NEAU-GS5]|nr:ATP-binding protein [Streptosporangiaceae bacterium NEAU-GS5]
MDRRAELLGAPYAPHSPSTSPEYKSRVFLFASVPESCSLARRCVRDVLTAWRLLELIEASTLLTSELVSNAIKHASGGGGDSELTLKLLLIYAAGTLRVELRDPDPVRLPTWRDKGELATYGYGLPLMFAYADRFGVHVIEAGKAVWCEIDLSDYPRPSRPRLVEPEEKSS